MVRLSDPDGGMAAYEIPAFKVSPDRRWLALALSRGDAQSGLAEYWISLLDINEVLSFVNDPDIASLPRIERIASFATGSNVQSIAHMEWRMDSQALLFIAKDREQSAQVYQLEIASRSLTRLTAHDSDVTRFALAQDGKTLVYAAVEYPDWTERNQHGYAVKSQYAGALLWTNPKDMPAGVRHYVSNVPAMSVVRVQMNPSRYADRIDVSPSGRRAAFVAFDIEGFPAQWLPYERVRQRARIESVKIADSIPDVPHDNDAFGSRSNWFGRLLMLDTRNGQTRWIMNSPATPQQGLRAVWSADEQSLLVLNALLPLEGITNPVEVRRRTHEMAVAELRPSDGHIARLMDVPAGFIAGNAAWISPGTVCVALTHEETRDAAVRTFERRGQAWRATRSRARCRGPNERVQFSVRQGMNLPYEVAAKDLVTSRERVITSLNPQLRERDLGKVAPFSWDDGVGRHYEGGLLLPPGYENGRRYPLVIQTYGFDAKDFVIDGPFGITSAYASRALAGTGILVLQMPLQESNPGAMRAACNDWQTCGENPLFQAKMDSAIDALTARDLIDPQRVGVLGFSREGMHVFHAITFTNHAIAAATVADSIGPSPFAYTLLYGFPYPGMLDYEGPRMMGAPFWGDGIAKWQERSPLFHLSHIRAAVRFETYGKGLSGYWDAFALLKRANRPADLIHLPLASHVLVAPFARQTSQEGNVDWFRFWLKDEQSADPRKAEQYVRWRRLRTTERQRRCRGFRGFQGRQRSTRGNVPGDFPQGFLPSEELERVLACVLAAYLKNQEWVQVPRDLIAGPLDERDVAALRPATLTSQSVDNIGATAPVSRVPRVSRSAAEHSSDSAGVAGSEGFKVGSGALVADGAGVGVDGGF